VVEREPVGSRVAATLAAGVAQVGLRGPQRTSLGRLGEAARVDADELLVHAQELLDGPLGLLVGLLAEVMEPDTTVTVDEVEGRPISGSRRTARW
jgi:hypothetical protein